MEHPILFSGEMVRAILENRKTQTRRVIKPQPEIDSGELGADCGSHWGTYCEFYWHKNEKTSETVESTDDMIGYCPYGKAGDRLWVRETWREIMPGRYAYKADGESKYSEWNTWKNSWKPSIHMPRIASRITLEVVKVRVERLQSITENDARAEGCKLISGQSYDATLKVPVGIDDTYHHQHSRAIGKSADGVIQMETVKHNIVHLFIGSFAMLWDKINAERGYSWLSNPFVWVIEFKKIDK